MNREDIRDWPSWRLSEKIAELEKAIEDLQQEYLRKKVDLLKEYNIVSTALSNKSIADKIRREQNERL